MGKVHKAVVAASALAGGVAAGAVLPADAATLVYTGTGVNIRADASTSATSLGQGQPGDSTTYHCSKAGTVVNGYTYWNNHTNSTRGVKGFSTMAYSYPNPTSATTIC